MGIAKLSQKQSGFTIVELLIVVVVIAILAAITIVAYNGIQNRAKESATSSAASQAAKKVNLFQIDNTSYPADKAAFLALGFTEGSTTYQYSVNNSATPRTFCVTATTGNISFYTSNLVTSPKKGSCQGHGNGGAEAITNFVPNPSFETGAPDGWNISMKNSDTATVSTVQAQSGTKSFAFNVAASGVDSYATQILNIQSGDWTVSAYVYIPNNSATYGARDAFFYNISNVPGAPAAVAYDRTKLNQWQRVSASFNAPTAGTIGIRFYGVPGGITYVDSIMLTKGNTLYSFADGNSENWVWNGTQNFSTSTGSPL